MNWLGALLKNLLPTILTWATSEVIKRVKEHKHKRKVKKENELELKRDRRLEKLQIELQDAIKNRDEKEIVRLNIAINTLKL